MPETATCGHRSTSLALAAGLRGLRLSHWFDSAERDPYRRASRISAPLHFLLQRILVFVASAGRWRRRHAAEARVSDAGTIAFGKGWL
jgi:hypothetical protein